MMTLTDLLQHRVQFDGVRTPEPSLEELLWYYYDLNEEINPSACVEQYIRKLMELVKQDKDIE